MTFDRESESRADLSLNISPCARLWRRSNTNPKTRRVLRFGYKHQNPGISYEQSIIAEFH